MKLALATGIPPAAWAHEGERAIETAWRLLEEAREQRQQHEDDGRQLAG